MARPQAGPPSPGAPGRRPTAPVIRGIAASGIVVGSAAALYAERDILQAGMRAVLHARPGWVAVGVALECMSMAGFVLLQHRLLKAAGARLTLTWLLVIDYVSNAIAVGVPIVGSGLLTGCGSAAAVALLFVVARSVCGRARLRPVGASVVRLAQRILHRPAGDPGVVATRAIDALSSLKLGPRAICYLLICSSINWAADASCLAAAIGALGMPIPWDKLLLVWSAGAGASTFSPTPFGVGVVEVTLIAALAAVGLSSPDAVGAVLLYRIMTFKVLGTLIWALYPHLKRGKEADGRR